MENAAKSAKWVRAAAIILIGYGILQIPYSRSDGTALKALLEVAIGVSAVAVIPIVMKLWPVPGETQVSLRRWALILGMMFIGDTIVRFQDDWFPRYPSSGKWVVAALFVLTGLIGLWLLSRDLKKTRETSVSERRVD